jgi:SNF2 family DNA or RNA helicase
MTATPHAGKEEDFQLFMALLDPDRYAGRYRKGVHASTTDDLMLRRVKEDLLTFDGRRLFPERIAQTLPYFLSDDEQELYEAVTLYVREEMNRADKLGAKRNTIGFALTVLQRRLASSPEAIYQSLRRRRARLEARRDVLIADPTAEDEPSVADLAGDADDDAFDPDAEFATAESEQWEDRVSDGATAARTIAELETEIAALTGLEALAGRVRASGTDRKWAELRDLISDPTLMRDDRGVARKLIVFTEHKDTLSYLMARLGDLIRRRGAVVAIHGAVSRHKRHEVRERFTHDPQCQILLATDAAGEGLNLQCAHLMINYDLPWNPNRIEQRFGRIHRIGQTEVCRLWNLVAENTREGQVFTTLLGKIDVQRKQYGGRVFDVLGSCFTETSRREVLIKAIRYGEDPDRKAELEQVIDRAPRPTWTPNHSVPTSAPPGMARSSAS